MADYPSKQSVLSKWFEGEHVLVHLDARRPGVDVPQHLRNNHSLTLKLSSYFQGPTTWNNECIIALLKFNGDYYRCVLPWGALWGMTSSGNEQRIWPEDLPTEVVRDLTLTKLREIGSRLLGIKRDKDKPSATDSDGKTTEIIDGTEDGGGDARRRKPTLRRIK